MNAATLFVRLGTDPESDLARGYSYQMSRFGDESAAEDGLSGYGVEDRGGLDAALDYLEDRMGLSGRFCDELGAPVKMYCTLYRGELRGMGMDAEELFRPREIVASVETTAGDVRTMLRAAAISAGVPEAELEAE